MTITPYGTDIEPYVPPYASVIEGFKHISKLLNSQSMVWRYDPIILTNEYTVDFHFESFYKMAKSLKDYTDTVVVSFLDIFDKVAQNFPEGYRPSLDVQTKIIKEFVSIAHSNHMTLKTCGEGGIFKELGADTEGCLTLDCYESAWNIKLKAPNERQHDQNVIVIYMVILVPTIAVATFVVIVMLILIKQSGSI